MGVGLGGGADPGVKFIIHKFVYNQLNMPTKMSKLPRIPPMPEGSLEIDRIHRIMPIKRHVSNLESLSGYLSLKKKRNFPKSCQAFTSIR